MKLVTAHPLNVENSKYGLENIGSKDSNSLKDLSMPEILKLAENRAKVEGTNRRFEKNPWRKRMAVSESASRCQRSVENPTTSGDLESLVTSKHTDDNDEFFNAILKKMTAEQFIKKEKKSQKSQKSRKRKKTCFWDKEYANVISPFKRYKDMKTNETNIMPKASSSIQLLFQQYDANPSDAGDVKSKCSYQGAIQHRDSSALKSESALNIIGEDINMNYKYNPNVINSRCHLSPLQVTKYPINPERLDSRKIDSDIACDTALSSCGCVKKYLKGCWHNLHPPKIKECRKPLHTIVVEQMAFNRNTVEYQRFTMRPYDSHHSIPRQHSLHQ